MTLHQILLAVLFLAVLVACRSQASPPADELPGLTLTSPAFEAGANIPPKYTCKGQDVSPPLVWSQPPQGTQSLALIMDDPDAPVGVWVHWVVYNIPADIRSLEEGIVSGQRYGDVTLSFGKNSWGKRAYGGPCPPSGTHRYYFKLYALDSVPKIPEGADKQTVEKAIEGHILAYGELMGVFSR